MSTYQCSVCFYICDLNLEVIEKLQVNNYRLSRWKKTVPFAYGNFRKFAGFFGRTVSMVILFSQIYPRNSDLLLPCKV